MYLMCDCDCDCHALCLCLYTIDLTTCYVNVGVSALSTHNAYPYLADDRRSVVFCSHAPRHISVGPLEFPSGDADLFYFIVVPVLWLLHNYTYYGLYFSA